MYGTAFEKDLDEEEDSSIGEDDSVQSLRKSPTSSPPPLTAVSAAAITPVRASSLNDNDMPKLYPNLSHAGWLLRRLSSHRRLVFSSCRTLVLLSSSHCAALLSSHCAVWLLRRLSSRRRLVLSSSSHSQRHSRRPRRWRSLSPAAPDVERCRRGGPRHCITVALTITLDAVSCPPTLSLW